MDTLAQYIQTLSPQLIAWRRDFHHFAESGWVEFRTAAKVAEILDSLGYELAMGRDVVDAESRMGLPDDATLSREFARARAQGAPEKWLAPFEGGFTGIVATLNTGHPGPTLAFRVDMDALDLSEALDESHRPFRDGFASCNAGMMHACAHDGHTTIGLGLAQVLKQNEAQAQRHHQANFPACRRRHPRRARHGCRRGAGRRGLFYRHSYWYRRACRNGDLRQR